MNFDKKPEEPQGNEPREIWARNLMRWISSLEIRGINGFKKVTSPYGGAEYVADEKPGSSSISINPYRIYEVNGDFYRCRAVQGSFTQLEDGDTDIYIARPPEHRDTITSETIDGTTYTYTYNSETERISTGDDINETIETQVINPHIILEVTFIYAVEATTGVTYLAGDDETETSVTLLDLNVAGRAWAKKY